MASMKKVKSEIIAFLDNRVDNGSELDEYERGLMDALTAYNADDYEEILKNLKEEYEH